MNLGIKVSASVSACGSFVCIASSRIAGRKIILHLTLHVNFLLAKMEISVFLAGSDLGSINCWCI